MSGFFGSIPWGDIAKVAVPAAVGIGTAYLGNQAAQSAAEAQARGLTAATAATTDNTAAALAAQREMFERALGYSQAGRDQARIDLSGYLPGAQQTLYGGQTNALQALAQGTQGAQAQLAPLAQAGMPGLNVLQQIATGGFQADPGYDFVRDQAMRGVERSAAARGGLMSGGTMAALQDRAAGLASQDYSSWANRRQQAATSLAGVGQGATSALAQLAATLGNNAAGIYSNVATQDANLLSGNATALANAALGAGNNQAMLAQGFNPASLYVGQGNALAGLAQAGGQNQGSSILAGNQAVNSGVQNALSLWRYANQPSYA